MRIIQFILVLISIPVGILRAYVFLSIWRWFVIPIFGLPDLTLETAFALMLFIAIGKDYTRIGDKTLGGDEVVKLQISSLIMNLIMIIVTWLIAWIVYIII